ncbi:MAG: Kelch repeat-containing protein, partial [Planctomycetota bacterium]
TLTGGALVLVPAGTNAPVSATVTPALGGLRVDIEPDGDLEDGREYQVRLSDLARRADGKSIRKPWFSTFRVKVGQAPPPPPPPPAPTGTVRGVKGMDTGRAFHAAVSLSDGRVAVFGGFSTSSEVTDSIEVFDPDAEEWTVAEATLTVARGRLSATRLKDGRVFVAGGETTSATDIGLDTWEIWDPADDAIDESGTMAERRTNHRSVLLADGTVLTIGGSRTDSPGASNFSRTSAEVFDPSDLSSVNTGSMSVPRAGHRATTLADGRVLVTGGHGSNRAAEVFNPTTGGFSGAGTQVSARRHHTATLLANGDVLLAGGGNFTAERWVRTSSTFVQVQNMGDERSHHRAVLLPGGRVFIAGGERPGSGGTTFLHNGVEFYNPPTITFLFSGLKLRTGRSGHSLTTLPGGDFLICGGKNNLLGSPAVSSCDRVSID